MNSSWYISRVGQVDIVRCSLIDDLGITYGFTGRDLICRGGSLVNDLTKLRELHACSSSVIPKQTHSAITIAAERIVGDSCEALEGDALIVPRDLTTKKQLYGIRTADCVPILVVTKKECALIHAGWRGLAQQIIQGALQQLERDSLFCAIGPCASALRYEVGSEVIAQIGDSARYTERDGRIFLDLVATTKEQLYRCAPNAQVTSSDICTIEDLRFHSHRRDGGDAGRNLMYYCTGV